LSLLDSAEPLAKDGCINPGLSREKDQAIQADQAPCLTSFAVAASVTAEIVGAPRMTSDSAGDGSFD
jgi:hypothetical protein